eukprot:335105-Hanusia_phi.AAC.1
MPPRRDQRAESDPDGSTDPPTPPPITTVTVPSGRARHEPQSPKHHPVGEPERQFHTPGPIPQGRIAPSGLPSWHRPTSTHRRPARHSGAKPRRSDFSWLIPGMRLG